MRRWIGRIVHPPVFSDAERTRRANALRACLAAYLLIAVIGIALAPFVAVPPVASAIFLSCVLLGLAGAFLLASLGRVTAAAFLFPFILWCALALLGLFGGGLRSFAFPLFGLVVLLSSLLVGPRGDAIFIPLSIGAGAVFYYLDARGLLPTPFFAPNPLALGVVLAVGWFLTGSAIFLSRRGPLDLIIGARRSNAFLIEQTRQLRTEIEQRREAEVVAEARTRSLIAASRMAVQCATAPRGSDPLLLIAEQIHEVTGAVGTVISTYDPDRRELHVRQVVVRDPLRRLGERIVGGGAQGMVVPVPPEQVERMLRSGVVETTDLAEVTFGAIPPSVAFALKKALHIERFTGFALHDADRILATVLVGLAPGTPHLDPEVTEIFSTVATMLLREQRAEDVVRESESRFKEMVDQLPQPVVELDAAGALIFANEMAREVFGGAGRDAQAMRPFDMVVPRDRRAARAEFASVRAGRIQRRTEFTCVRADGSPFTAVISARPIRRGNRVSGVRGVIADVSSVRKAEEDARDSRRMLQLVLDLIPQSIFWKDTKSRYLGCNGVFAEMAGLARPEDVVGLTDDDLLWSGEAESYREIDMQVLTSGSPRDQYVQTMVTNAGENRQVRVSKLPLRSADGTLLGVLGVAEDITAWISSEAERLLLGTAIEKAVESVVITDAAGAIEYVNPVFLKNFGYTREEVLGRNPRLLKSGRHDEEYYRELWATIDAGKVWQGKFYNLRKDRSLLIEEAIISPVLGPGGTASHFVKVARDVTYEMSLEERFQQAQKMEAVGRLAGGMAHDFNNILTVISGYSEILDRTLGNDGQGRDEIRAIIDAAARASTLTGQLLAFSRKQKLQPQVIELNAVVRGIEQMLRRLIGEDVDLTTELVPFAGNVFVDKGQIEQVILNLAVNARDAMPKGGHLHLQTRTVQPDEALLDAHVNAAPGPYAVLEVTDTGTGMTEEVKAHLFEPFFTTKPEHKGTGLGLATVYGIVAQSGGFIEVDSRVDVGTRFQIYIPLTQAAETARTKTRHEGPSAGRMENILLVEDDPAIRKLLLRSLRESGYAVKEAADGARALEILRREPGSINLLVTDVIMPDRSGPELADVVRREQPGIKVLFISGYTSNETVEYGVLGSELNLLQKPFSMQELSRRVRETLDRA